MVSRCHVLTLGKVFHGVPKIFNGDASGKHADMQSVVLRANSDQQTTYLWQGAKADHMFPRDSVLTGY